MSDSIFSKQYNREKFLKFLRVDFLPEDFESIEKELHFCRKTEYSQSATKLGYSESLKLVVYELQHKGKEDPRVALSKEAFRLLSQEWHHRALVVFVPQDCTQKYRLSLIEIQLEGDVNDAKIHRTYSNPRRYSFLLGPESKVRTADEYLVKKGRVLDWADLKNRFSVEMLTKEFYQELQDWFFWAVKIVNFPNDLKSSNDDEFKSEAVIRLITRLIFVWFLKQKKLVPKELFDDKFIEEQLLRDFKPHTKVDLFSKDTSSKYYKAILQNLFFAMLNSPITPDNQDIIYERRFAVRGNQNDHDNNKLMRYDNLFKNPDLLIDLANKHVPFLNGGLFDCLDDKTNGIYIDGFSNRTAVQNKLVIPDFLFFGEEAGKGIDLSEFYGDKKKKTVNARGIIDILKRYNFTIEENMPFDQEVSLDPELLGKVFENLLASYNPETQTTARKQTGSFYTPREVVQYMVDESLIIHLKNRVTPDLEDQYRQLMQYTDEAIDLTDEQKRSIIESLSECKILDPACGSGAFPMGILQQMVHILSKLDSKNEVWKEVIKKDAEKEFAGALDINSTEERNEVLSDINKTFDSRFNNPDYSRKLYLIENCIYGVDIQTIAIQISKLRFFISLIVDQKTNNDPLDNFGVRPLPNLEAKFVAANTLLGLNKKESSVFDNPRIKEIEAKMKISQHKIFLAKNYRTKRRHKDLIKGWKAEIANLLSADDIIDNEQSKLLSSWDMFNQNEYARFFDSDWMFGVDKGFDIVIGNPPYLKEGRASKSVFDGVRESKYYQGKMDLWYMFACCGIDFLTSNGVLCFIATNNWVTNSGASIMRNKIIKDSKILQMCDFSNFMIFESASIQTMVMLFERNKDADDYQVDYRRLKGDTTLPDVVALLDKTPTPKVEYLSPIFNRKSFEGKYITFSSDEAILDKIAHAKNVIYLTDNEVAQGIVPNPDVVNSRNIQRIPLEKVKQHNINVGDGVFVLPKGFFCNINDAELKYIKPLYEPVDMSRYYLGSSNNDIIYITKSNFKGDAPIIIDHLEKYREIMEDRRENKNGRISYYHLHWPRTEVFFTEGEKILVPRKCSNPCFVYTYKESYVMMSVNVIKTDRVNMKYLTGLLNSKLIQFWLKNRGKMQGLNYQLDKEPLVAIPIAVPSKEVQTKIAALVDYIIWLKANQNDLINDYVDNAYIITVIEEIIDALLFEVYFTSEFILKNIAINSLVEIASNASEFYKNIKADDSLLLNQIKLMKVELKEFLMSILSL